jgi:hypothetical protein
VRSAFSAPRFHEAVLLLDRPVAPVLEALAARGIEGGFDLAGHYPELGHRAAGVRDRDQERAPTSNAMPSALPRWRCAARAPERPIMMRHALREPLIFEYSRPGRGARAQWPARPARRRRCPARQLRRRTRPLLPEVSELDAVRHYTRLSQLNFSIDTHFYPLGSCTMKYNPKACNAARCCRSSSAAIRWPAVAHGQGFLACMYELQEMLQGVTGMRGVALSRWPARTASSPASR